MMSKKITNNLFELTRNATTEERSQYDHYLFGLMRNSTHEERIAYEKMLKKYFVPIERSIWDMNDIEVDYCDICHKRKQIKRKYYYYDINCDCCGSSRGHFEIIRYCDKCTPKPPKRINVMMEPYND